MEVFSEEWAQACCERLNARETYRTAGAAWTWPVVLVLSAGGAEGGVDRAVLLDLHRGECRGTRLATAQDIATTPYVLGADLAGWREMLVEGLDPVAALLRGRLKLVRGNLLQMSRYTDAAREMLAAAAEVGGTFAE